MTADRPDKSEARRTYSYTESEWARVAARVQAAAKAQPVDLQACRDEIESILSATGVLTQSEEENSFADAVRLDEHHAMYGRATEVSRDAAFRPSLVAARRMKIYNRLHRLPEAELRVALLDALKDDPVVGSEMRAVLGARAKGGTAPWGFSGAELRAAAQQLRYYYRPAVRAGQPRKPLQDTLLYRLAEIFLRHSGSSFGAESLPHSQRSNFVQFAHSALRPFFPLSEATPAALASAWGRMKKADAAGGK